MALFETPAAPASSAARGRSGEQREQAKVWLNIGYWANDRFVSLPVGIPLDTMQPASEDGQNADWVQYNKARNKLLKWLMSQSEELAPGEAEPIEGLSLQVRRVGAPLRDEDLGANPYDMPTAPVAPVEPPPAPPAKTRRQNLSR